MLSRQPFKLTGRCRKSSIRYSQRYIKANTESSAQHRNRQEQNLAAKIGVRVDNDIAWAGLATNYAAKLTSFENMDRKFQIRISEQAMQVLGLTHFTRTVDGTSVWEGPYSNLSRGQHYSTNCRIAL